MDSKILLLLAFLGAGIFVMLIDVSLPAAFVSPMVKIILLIFALFLDIIAFSSRFYSYLLLPMMKQRSRKVILSNDEPYWLSTSEDAIMHREGEDFAATVFVKIPMYVSATQMNDEEKLDFTRQVARLISLSREPVRFTSQMYMMNKDNYIKTLRDTINEADKAEASLSEGTTSAADERVIRGKSSMWHHLLDNVTSAPSFELVSYASVSSRSIKEFEAVAEAQQRAKEVISGIAAVFGVSPAIVTGTDLLKFVEPEHTIPYSTVAEQITKSVREQVI
jgi:hypothetical protein